MLPGARGHSGLAGATALLQGAHWDMGEAARVMFTWGTMNNSFCFLIAALPPGSALLL